MSPVSSRRIRMSRPDTTSGLSVDASASSGKTDAGRRLANRSSSFRSRRSACSGRLSRGKASYLGPPTAPKRTASAFFASASVASGIGSPPLSKAAPPTGACSSSSLRPSRPKAPRTLTASAMTSGPTPSPGRTAIFMGSAEQPGLLAAAPFLEGADLVRVAQREPDVVEAVGEAVFAERVDVEAHRLGAVRGRDDLLFEIDDQPESGERGDFVQQPVHLGFGEHDGEQAVLAAVVEEDIGVRGCDDRAKSVLAERPGRVLARAAAAEVLACDQDARTPVARLVEHEVGVDPPLGLGFARPPLVEIAPGVEKIRTEPCTLDRLQELLGDDLVGVDVGPVHRRNQSVQHGEFFHRRLVPYLHWRTSTKWPSIAAAAAISGLTRWVRPPVPCLPSKFRFEVEAERSPGSSRSAFMARHIEQPGSRHSNPASLNTRSRPSFSACALTNPDPGTTIASLTLDATRRPRTIAAAARRSSMRELVHEPMNTFSMRISVIGVLGARPM